MRKNSWYTLAWKDNSKTVPSTRAIWLTNCQLLSVHYENGIYIAAVSPNKWGPIVLDDCSSWAEAEEKAIQEVRKELIAMIHNLQ